MSIRQNVNAKFVALVPKLAAGELTGAEFRAKVMQFAVDKLGVNVQSAATHYNHAFKTARAEGVKGLDGLGRDPSRNNGGRKPVHTVSVIKVKTGEVVAEGLSKGKAEAMIEAAARSRKAKLEIAA